MQSNENDAVLLDRILRECAGSDMEGRFEHGRVEADVETTTDPTRVREALERMGSDGRGWVETTGALEPWSDSVSEGVVLSAEVSARSGESLSVRRKGSGWVLTTTSVVDTDDPHECVERITHRSRRGFPTLRYAIGWRADGPGGRLAPYATHPEFANDVEE